MHTQNANIADIVNRLSGNQNAVEAAERHARISSLPYARREYRLDGQIENIKFHIPELNGLSELVAEHILVSLYRATRPAPRRLSLGVSGPVLPTQWRPGAGRCKLAQATAQQLADWSPSSK